MMMNLCVYDDDDLVRNNAREMCEGVTYLCENTRDGQCEDVTDLCENIRYVCPCEACKCERRYEVSIA